MTLPDTKLAAVTWVAAHADLPAGVTVAGAAQDTLTSDTPYVAFYRPPSPPPKMWARHDVALLNVQTWASSESLARSTADAVHTIMHLLPGQTVETVPDPDVPATVVPVHVHEVDDVTGLGLVHDPGLPDLARMVFTVRVVARVGD